MISKTAFSVCILLFVTTDLSQPYRLRPMLRKQRLHHTVFKLGAPMPEPLDWAGEEWIESSKWEVMFGDVSCELVRSLDRNSQLLAGYEDDKVRQVIAEVTTLVCQNEDAIRRLCPQDGGSEEGQTSLARMRPLLEWRHGLVERDKRCLLAYHYHRLDRIRKMRWEFGSTLPADVRSNLSLTEQDFFNKYNQSLAKYMASVGVDLLQDQKPPKDLRIHVQCIADYGELETSTGAVIQLKKNTQHFLPTTDCERLVRQGVVKHVQ